MGDKMTKNGGLDAGDKEALSSLRNLLDRQAILDCLTRCSRGIDRLDRELVLSAYHPDAIDDHGMFLGTPAEFFDWFRGLQGTGTPAPQLHHLTNHSCEIKGDVAHAETYYLATTGSDPVVTAYGRYIDRLERRDGQWKIALRYCLMEWLGNSPKLNISLGEATDNGVPSRTPQDPSYRRPFANKRPIPAAAAG
jgi:hypothetical protein